MTWQSFTWLVAFFEDNVLNKFRIRKERHIPVSKPYELSDWMKNSSRYNESVVVRSDDGLHSMASSWPWCRLYGRTAQCAPNVCLAAWLRVWLAIFDQNSWVRSLMYLPFIIWNAWSTIAHSGLWQSVQNIFSPYSTDVTSQRNTHAWHWRIVQNCQHLWKRTEGTLEVEGLETTNLFF